MAKDNFTFEQWDAADVRDGTPELFYFAKISSLWHLSALICRPMVALQRIYQFVGRTTNWLYDHLRYLPQHRPVILCDQLINREEFPQLEARTLSRQRFDRRVWRRLTHNHPYPTDWWYVKRLAPCLFHSHFGDRAAEDYDFVESLGIPWFVSFYGADIYELGRETRWQDIYQQTFARVARVLVLGPKMKSQLEAIGCPPNKITIHPLGVCVQDLPFRPRILGKDEPLRILFAGTFREKKGIQYVIEAAALLRSSKLRFELHLVGDAAGKKGDDETKAAIFALIARFGLENVVKHSSYLAFRGLISLALDSHVFIAPSVTAANGDAEGTPFVLQQMMATSMPVIATTHSDIPYIFGEHASTMLVPERDAPAIALKLQRYIESPATLVEDGAKLRQQICSGFDVRSCAVRLRDVYESAL